MSSRVLIGALMTSAFLAVAASSPALACKGATSLLRDDFTDVDPAWAEFFDADNPSFTIGSGKVLAKSAPGYFQVLLYQGSFFADGDACVTITSPSVRSPTDISAGIALTADDGSIYFPSINLDGTAGVSRLTGAGWLNPVPARKFAGIKGGAAANTLRVVWKGPPPQGSKNPADPTVQIFINDKPFINFKMNPNADRKFGLYAQTEGNTYQFSDLAITR